MEERQEIYDPTGIHYTFDCLRSEETVSLAQQLDWYDSRAEWEALLELTRKALRENGVAAPEEAEFLALFERYRNDIVETE